MSAAPTYDDLAAKYRPVFERIAEHSLARELERTLPFEQVGWLKDAGFTGVRVPAELGGDGATIPQLFRLLVELAAADPHIPQAFRGHIAFVEDRLFAADSPERETWLRRFAAGELVGNAATEIGSVALGDVATRLTRAVDGWTISGSKYYTTGSIFAEWIDTAALLPDGTEVAALVRTGTDAVRVSDDWTGFGQRLTGSGTAVFDAARVEDEDVFRFSDRFPYQTALYQLVLVAVLAGIAQNVAADAAEQVATRARSFSHGNTARTRDDPQVLEAVGRTSADAFAASSITIGAAELLQRAFDLRDGSEREQAEAKLAAEIAASEAQIVVSRVTLESATRLFDPLGASAVSVTAGLDRHWRNARTVSSHNPVAFKARIVGDYRVNGTEPPYEWYVGVPPKSATTE